MAIDLRLRRAAGLVCATTAGLLLASCLDRPIGTLDPRTTSTTVEPLTQSRISKIDLLFAIDNSASMADKQSILSEAVPDLLRRLVLPRCLDSVGADTGLAADADGTCPAGSEVEFRPVADIHIGIISSSLGDLGGTQCQSGTKNDAGHLVSRAASVATFQDKGFLAWDPAGEVGGTTDAVQLQADMAQMVREVGQDGCGFEMQLESVVRFLADPAPYKSIYRDENGRVHRRDVDDVLLAQRADFLRPDSLVAVLLLSDENDCSINPDAQAHDVLGSGGFFKATAECALDPNDPCCTSCALPNPSGCAADPDICGPKQGTLAAAKYDAATEDLIDRRCWDQKRRYGVDVLYPTARYVNALSQEFIDPARADFSVVVGSEPVRNPLFAIGSSGFSRTTDRVFFATLVGVPWQAIAKQNEAGEADLSLGFMSVSELTQNGRLAQLVGDPDKHIGPSDPFMIEHYAPRGGQSAILGATPATSNAINGGDRAGSIKDLQYACTFELSDPDPLGSDCSQCTAGCSHPLCNGTTQVAAKAYPGVRELAVAAGLGEQGIMASICPEHTDAARPDTYGYAPAVRTIIDRLKVSFLDRCLPKPLAFHEDGSVQCLVIEAQKSEGEACCTDRKGRQPIDPSSKSYNAVEIAKQNPFNPGWDCFCEVTQLRGEEQQSCQNDAKPQNVDGFCYVDAETVPPIGEASLVPQHCGTGERRILRFVGEGEPQSDAVTFITCLSDDSGG